MLNQLLGGHYLVVQSLGEGGLAKTYIAEDHHRPGHPKCAVKYLKPASNDPAFLPTARRLFNKEAEILEKLGQHDQIPRLLAYFEENQEFYLVQEFIEGHLLSAELLRDQCWSGNKVIQMLRDVLHILKFVHSYRVIHRDIKPNNLIRRQKDGRLVLIDFGAVKQVRDPSITAHGSLTQKTISIGTQGYTPTEQVRGKPRLNSDIYALGVIGIQALTGIHPLHLEEDDDGEIIWQSRAEVSDELAAILTKMVRYHFKERYQSATEVLDALESLAHHSTYIQSNLTTGQTNQEVAVDEQEKVSLVSPAVSSTPSENLELSQTNIFVHPNKSRLMIGAGIVSALASIVAAYTYITYRHSSLRVQGALEKIEMMKIAEKYQECVQQDQTSPQNYSDLQTQGETALYECQQGQAERQLAEAKKLAEQSKLKDAISIAAQISIDTDIYSEAQPLIHQWSEKIFQIASNEYQEGNLTEATAIAQAIPADSLLASKVEITIQQWNEEWKQNQTHLQIAQKALDERRWQDAIDTAQKVSDTDYWQKQKEPIIEQAEAGISAAQAPASRNTSTTPRQTYTPPPSSITPRQIYTPPSSSFSPKSLPKREPIPSTAPFPMPRSNSNSSSPRSSPVSRPRSNSTEWTCLNNPNPKCHK